MCPAPEPDLSVMVMAYDEVQSLEGTVTEIAAVLQGVGGTHEIVIIDDGSRDGTPALADDLAARIPCVRVVHHPVNEGLGGVYRTGFAEARGRHLTFFPADGQFPASIIAQFAPLAAAHDLVLGYLPQRRDDLRGRVLSAVERLLYRFVFGQFPRFQGILMVRRAVLQGITLRSRGRGWAVVMEMILAVARAGRPLISVPTEYRPRRFGRSKVTGVRTIWSNFQQLVTLRRLR